MKIKLNIELEGFEVQGTRIGKLNIEYDTEATSEELPALTAMVDELIIKPFIY